MIDFPANPTVGQQFTAAGVTWTWDGTKWTASGLGVAYLPLAGGTMLGPIVLAADPAAALQPATKQYVDGASFGGFVNKFRNGTMDVWQRGTPVNVAVGAITFTADGWSFGTAGSGTVVVSTGAGRGPTLNSLAFTGAAGITALNVRHRIESYIASPLGGVATVQFQLFNNTGATVTPQLTVGHASAADNFATVVNDLPATNLQPCPTGVWTRLAYTFNLPQSSANLGVEVMLSFGAQLGANGVRLAEADIRVTPGWPVGLCANPPPPELRPVATELAFCQRYYEYAPNSTGMYYGYVNTGNSYYANVLFKAQKRAAPTVVGIDISNSGFAAGAPSINTTNINSFQAFKATNVSAASAASYFQFGYTASAEL